MDILREEKIIYVINHAMGKGGERIEKFQVITDDKDTPISLKYVQSITSDAL